MSVIDIGEPFSVNDVVKLPILSTVAERSPLIASAPPASGLITVTVLVPAMNVGNCRLPPVTVIASYVAVVVSRRPMNVIPFLLMVTITRGPFGLDVHGFVILVPPNDSVRSDPVAAVWTSSAVPDVMDVPFILISNELSICVRLTVTTVVSAIPSLPISNVRLCVPPPEPLEKVEPPVIVKLLLGEPSRSRVGASLKFVTETVIVLLKLAPAASVV